MTMPISAEAASAATQSRPAVLAAAGQFTYRFFAAYFILEQFPFPFGALPYTGWPSQLWGKLQALLFKVMGDRVLHLPSEAPSPNGSGDRAFNFVYYATFLALALVVAAIWSALSRERPSARARVWIAAYVRYPLAFALIGYGAYKVFPLQFPAPGPGRLMETVGDLSPMGLLWTFMGHSPAYQLFGGALEVLAGALLLFRRTATLGALVGAGVMGNIVMLNLCYDVPVKLYSTHLLAACLFLIAPQASRLASVLVLNRPVPAQDEPALFDSVWLRRGALVLKLLLLGTLVYGQWTGVKAGLEQRKGDAKTAFLRGLFAVEQFERKGQPVAPGDAASIRKVAIGPFNVEFKRGDDKLERQRYELDPEGKTLKLTRRGTPPVVSTLAIERPGEDALVLKGELAGEPVRLQLRRIPADKVTLNSIPFRWINDYPDNR